MSARRPPLPLNPLAWLRSGLVAPSLTLLTPIVVPVQAAMIGAGAAPRPVAVGDLNGDGFADLVSGNNNDNAVSVLIAPTAEVTSPNGGEVIHQNQEVTLQWTATDNVAVSGVDIQLVDGATVTTLAGNHPNTGSYASTASRPASTGMRLRVIAHDDPGHETTDDSDADWELSPYVIGVEDGLPPAFVLAAPSPNPSPAGLNRITFAVPREAHVRLTVHDVRGRTLAKLVEGTVPAGRHVRNWDSTPVAAGVYFLRFEAPGFHADRRLVVVR